MRTEIRGLTGLRGVAALIVVWFHMKEALGQRDLDVHLPLIVERLFFNGGHSVDVFFVLSGFILTLTYRSWFGEWLTRERYFQFLRRRFARIYPLHFVVLVMLVAFVALARAVGLATVHGLDRFDYATLPQYFLLVQAWGPFMDGIGEWNPPAWSISVEVLAYWMLPVLVWITVRGARHRVLLLAFAVLAGCVCNWLTPWDNYGFPGVSRGLSEFALGAVAVNFLESAVADWLRSEAGSLAASAALLIACIAVEDTGFVVGLFTAPLLIALCGKNNVGRFLGSPALHYLGEISYSIYLGHFLFTSIAWRFLAVRWAGHEVLSLMISVVLATGVVIGLSSLTYFAVEQPGRRLFRERADPPSHA